jgi:hypothetical protein
LQPRITTVVITTLPKHFKASVGKSLIRVITATSMEAAPPTRGAARGFHPCQYSNSKFGTANARRLHELYSSTCVRLAVQARASRQTFPYALPYAQYAVANRPQVAGYESDGFPTPPSPGGLHGPQSPAGERADEPPEKPAPAIPPMAPQDPGKRPVPPPSPCFNQRNEMLLALQTAGQNGKSVPPAGLKRLFRVFHQSGFSFEEFLKTFPNEKAVAQKLSKVALKAVRHWKNGSHCLPVVV